MCGECRAELKRRGLEEQFKAVQVFSSDAFMLSQANSLVCVSYMGEKLCKKWWDETVVGVAGGEGAPFGFP